MFKKLATFVVIIIIICLASLFWFLSSLYSSVKISEPRQFTVHKGQGVNEISRNLSQQKLIKSRLVFEIYLYLKKIENVIKAGDYTFSQDLNIKELVHKLIQGATQDEYQITIIEGWNLEQIGDYLEKKAIVDKKIFLDQTKSGSDINLTAYEFLQAKPQEASLEGFLFPDTYRIYKDAVAADIIHKMLGNFDKKFTLELRQDLEKQKKNIFEVITLASVIEKEARTLQDKKIVADIFWKRLSSGKALESCATINYITGKNNPAAAWDDLGVESPYNTYKYPGLPPGPICNPSLDSILAAIYPEKTDYWYFLNDTQGEIHFSKNFEEHKQNKWRYLK